MNDDLGPGYATPEAAALSSFSPSAGVRVIRVEVQDDDRADVIVDTEPSHPMRCFTVRVGDHWHEAGDVVE